MRRLALAAAGVLLAHPRHAALAALVAGLLLGGAPPGWALAATVLAGAVPWAASRAYVAPPGRVVAGAGLGLVTALAVLGGAALADARLEATGGARLQAAIGSAVTVRATLLEAVRERAGGPAVAKARIAGGTLDGQVAVLRVMRGASHPAPWPRVGEEVDVSGRVATLGPFDAYQRPRGAAAAIDATSLRATGARRGGVAGALDSVRARAERGLDHGLRPHESDLLRGMVLGEDDRLDDEVKLDFQRSGLAHLLAVSGQNVVLLCVLVLGACALTTLPLRGAAGARARARRRVRPARGRRAVDPARRGDGRGGSRRRPRGAAGVALVRGGAGGGRDAGAQSARDLGPGLAAVVRRRRRPARALLAAAGHLRAVDAAPGRGGGGDDRRGDRRDRAAARGALRAGVARLAAGEPARRARRRADHVARDALGGGRAGLAGARGAAERAGRAVARLPRGARPSRRGAPVRRPAASARVARRGGRGGRGARRVRRRRDGPRAPAPAARPRAAHATAAPGAAGRRGRRGRGDLRAARGPRGAPAVSRRPRRAGHLVPRRRPGGLHADPGRQRRERAVRRRSARGSGVPRAAQRRGEAPGPDGGDPPVARPPGRPARRARALPDPVAAGERRRDARSRLPQADRRGRRARRPARGRAGRAAAAGGADGRAGPVASASGGRRAAAERPEPARRRGHRQLRVVRPLALGGRRERRASCRCACARSRR